MKTPGVASLLTIRKNRLTRIVMLWHQVGYIQLQQQEIEMILTPLVIF
jgi:hypothetical protein